MSISQSEKAQSFATLHERPGIFVIANAFDGCSARILASLGFEALATSSWVQAALLGKRDGSTTQAEALAHATQLVKATDLPVSADLEKGFGDAPEDVAATIKAVGGIGLVGGSIEDATGDPAMPIYDMEHAVQRVKAAVAAARDLPFKFTLTARSENFVRGINNLDDTIARLQAFEAAGADVLMAPGLPDLEAVRQVCASLKKPVNFMAGIPGQSFSKADLAAVGVKRISLATSLYNCAMVAALEAAREIKDHGTFGYIDRLTAVDLTAFLKD
ncbi:MAG: isocitrate lyase/phosphoenolpyruvate mutase family protein [Cyanobacteria bacterium J06554_11]